MRKRLFPFSSKNEPIPKFKLACGMRSGFQNIAKRLFKIERYSAWDFWLRSGRGILRGCPGVA
jgi:hypothetical protein